MHDLRGNRAIAMTFCVLAGVTFVGGLVLLIKSLALLRGKADGVGLLFAWALGTAGKIFFGLITIGAFVISVSLLSYLYSLSKRIELIRHAGDDQSDGGEN